MDDDGGAEVIRLDGGASDAIVRRRLRTQQLAGEALARPEDVVGWLGAVQSQDYGPAKWAVGMRQRRASDAAVERAFAEGFAGEEHRGNYLAARTVAETLDFIEGFPVG